MKIMASPNINVLQVRARQNKEVIISLTFTLKIMITSIFLHNFSQIHINITKATASCEKEEWLLFT